LAVQPRPANNLANPDRLKRRLLCGDASQLFLGVVLRMRHSTDTGRVSCREHIRSPAALTRREWVEKDRKENAHCHWENGTEEVTQL
jgi:hypothetical protein